MQHHRMRRASIGILVACIAYVALAKVETTSAIQALIALPGAAGLLAALWELLKANIEHQHRLEEANSTNAFILSATSHMAVVAFDKHVEFAEAYTSKANEGLDILFREGSTEQILRIVSALSEIRRKYVLWETKDVAILLYKFEGALTEIGRDERRLGSIPVSKKREELLKKISATFEKVTGLENLPDQPTPEISVGHIVGQLREHLGVNQLTELRKHYLDEATKRKKDSR